MIEHYKKPSFSDTIKAKVGKLAKIINWQSIIITESRSNNYDNSQWIEAKYKGKFVFVGNIYV